MNLLDGFKPTPDLIRKKSEPLSTNVPEDIYRDFLLLVSLEKCSKGHYLREIVIHVVKRARKLGLLNKSA